MQTLIGLLERKNLCFKSFNKLCLDFVDEIARGDTSNLETFQRRRQGLIKVLEQLEFEVSHSLDTIKNIAPNQMPVQTKDYINKIFKEREALVKSIVGLDLQILGHIDRIKDDTIQKLQALQTSRRTIGAYRSPMEKVEKAEKDKAQDREA